MSSDSTVQAPEVVYYGREGSRFPATTSHDPAIILPLLKKHGCIIIKKFIPAEMCERVVDETWDFLKATKRVRRERPADWCNVPNPKMGFAEMYASESQFRIRTYTPLIQLWQAVLGRREIGASCDRVGCKPPLYVEGPDGQQERYESYQRADLVHTDINLWYPPKCHEYQGLVALQDTAVGQGGFACIPEYDVDRHCAMYPPAPEVKKFVPMPDMDDARQKLVIPPYEQGDYVIWSSTLPHCGSVNESSRWRYALYVRYFPADYIHAAVLEDSANAFHFGVRPKSFSLGGRCPQDERQAEEGRYRLDDTLLPTLSADQRAVVGLEPWQRG